MNKVTIPEEWDGWYFRDGFLCTPEGDRITQGNVKSAQIIRQVGCYREVGEYIFYNHQTKSKPKFLPSFLFNRKL